MEISTREKNIVIAGAVFLAVFFGYNLVIAPIFEKRENLHRALAEKKQGIVKMESLFKQHLQLSGTSNTSADVIASRKQGFSLFSFLDLQAQQSGVKENVAYMKPFTRKDDSSKFMVATVKVKLKEIYLKQLVDFVYRIESSQNGVSITSLSLTKAGKNKTMLDAVLETKAVIKKEGV